MKAKLIAIALVAAIAGCASWQPKTQTGKSLKAWWNDPVTQERVSAIKETVVEAAVNFATNAGFIIAEQLIKGASLDGADIARSAGWATLYQSASRIRQLQGTTQVFDAEATADLLMQGGTPEDIAKEIALALIRNAKAAMIEGDLDANEAAELNAAGLDRAATTLAK